MAGTYPAYAPEFRRQMVELVRAGHDPVDPALPVHERKSGLLPDPVDRASQVAGPNQPRVADIAPACAGAPSSWRSWYQARGRFFVDPDALACALPEIVARPNQQRQPHSSPLLRLSA